MKKQELFALVHDFPEEFDAGELLYRLYVIAKLEKSEVAIAEQGLIADEELDGESYA